MANYINYLLSKKALKHGTIKRKVKAIKSLLKARVDLADADRVVLFLNECSWKNGTKDITANAYRDYLNMIGLADVKLPEFRHEETLPFVPLEAEIDALIAGVRMKIAAFLRLLKDTGARPIEAWRLKWIEIDITNRAVTITPAKYSHARKLKITEQTLNMILALPRKGAYVFSPTGQSDRFESEVNHLTRNYQKCRNRIADKLRNPRLRQISLRTFRHWKATMLYHQTKDILFVKETLGHVNIKNTLKYIHLANAISGLQDTFICKVASTVEEATALIEQGFEFVTEFEGVRLFRKRE